MSLEVLSFGIFFGAFSLAFATLLVLILVYPHQVYKDTLGKQWISQKSATLGMVLLTIGVRVGRFKEFESYDFDRKVPRWIFLLCWLCVVSFLISGLALVAAFSVHSLKS